MIVENATEKAAAEQPRSTESFELPEEESAIDLVEVFRTVARGKKLIAKMTIASVSLAIAIAFLLPPRYTSSTSFIPPSLGNNSSMMSAIVGQLSPLGGGDLFGAGKTSGELYAGILRSRSVTGDLVKRFDLMKVYGVKRESQAEKALQGSTAITIDTKSAIVTVNVTAKSPELAQNVAAAYMDALRQTNGRLALGQSSQRRMFFEQQLAREKNDLEDAEVEFKKTEESSGLIAPSGQTEAQFRTIAETQAQLAARQVQLAALRQSSTEQNPEVIRLRSEIEDLQAQLERLQRGNQKRSAINIPTSQVPEAQLQYVRKQREVKYHEALFEMLAKQFEAARLDEAHDAPVIQVLDSASYPDIKSSPRRLYFALAGLLVGLIGGSAWVLIRAALARNALSSPQDIPR